MTTRYAAELDSYARLADRFWSHVDQSAGPDECWPWLIGCNPRGYGNFQFRVNGQHYTFQASRWALGHSLGAPLRWEDETHEEACHRCDNPPCCNPAHLYVGSHAQNLAEAGERGGSRGPSLRRGQPQDRRQAEPPNLPHLQARDISEIPRKPRQATNGVAHDDAASCRSPCRC